MTIDLALIILQTLFLSLYGVYGIVLSVNDKKSLWIIVLGTLLGISISSLFWESYLKSNVQLLLFLLLVVDYLLRSLVFRANAWVNTLVFSLITFMAFTLPYFLWKESIIWGVLPFIFLVLFGLIKKWTGWFANTQEYVLKAGILLTVLFVIEPIALSIQQNLKPITTIPMASIINQQNLLLIGTLVVLTLLGFFGKKNQDFKSMNSKSS